jgi:Type I phosphodiesterase / nucleotide pyrophosphatase
VNRSSWIPLGLGLLFASCAGGPSPPPRHPVLLIGVDGLEWSVLLPLIHRGELPAIRRLMERGVFGKLETFKPTFSPVIWTSIATGKGPREHGILGFVYREERTREPRLYTSGHRRTKAFWNILSDSGQTVHCIGWWNTFPVEDIEGVMVAQTNTAGAGRGVRKGSVLANVEGQVWPDSMREQVMAIVNEVEAGLDVFHAQTFGTFQHPLSELDQGLWDDTRWSLRADAIYLKITEHILSSRERYDLLAMYLGSPDVTGHRFWRYMRPGEFTYAPTPAQLANFGEIVRNDYRWLDGAIGRLLDSGPEGLTVILISDHGMHAINRDQFFDPDDPPRSVNSGHHEDAPPGVFIASGRGIAAAPTPRALPETPDGLSMLGTVMDVAPTLLALKGIPIGKDMRGRVLTAVMDPDFLERHPPSTIETHDTAEWIAGREIRSRDAAAEQERLEQLRSLGYIQ